METKIPNLPEEIIQEILVRLSVKSLSRLKSVSKSWYSLISGKDFIKAHLERSSKAASFSSHRIIERTTSRALFQVPVPSFVEPLTPVITHSDYPLYKPNDEFYVVGCCNGLVCMHIVGKGLILWNPSTKQYKKLPPLDDTTQDHSMVMYGLGYDESSDDYKVFGVLFLSSIHYQHIFVAEVCVAKVYSLKMDSWRDIHVATMYIPVEPRGKLASKNLHWIVIYGNKSNESPVIVSFDSDREVFGSIDLPSSVHGDPISDLSLSEIDRRLCLLRQKPFDEIEFWVLEQYGVEDSWNKVFNINYPFFPFGPFWEPISPGDYDEILVYAESLVSPCCVHDGVEHE